jgi:hypothetical protein
MFPLNTILAWNINITMNKKYDNNNIIIAARAYFLHPKRIYFPEHFCCCFSSNLCVLNTTNMD